MKLLSFMFWKRVELKTNDDVKKKKFYTRKIAKSSLTKAKSVFSQKVVHILKQLLKFYKHKFYVFLGLTPALAKHILISIA